uniref:ARID domain-containing protein n=1 Tax=Caenorhabditis tropicalis TaxID=1561998 RepID=A0A1I7UY53_9PELO
MPGDDNSAGSETNEDKPTTSNSTATDDQPQRSDELQHPQKRGEDADRYAASVAEVAHGGGGNKKDNQGTSAPNAPMSTPPQQTPAPQPPLQAIQQQPPQHNIPPNNFAPPPGHHPPPTHHAPHPGMPPMDWRPPPGSEHQIPRGYPPGYPPYGMPPGHHPGYPPPPHGYGYPPAGPYGYPPQMMRPPMMGPPGDMVRMPPGPTPTEWAAQQAQAAAASRGVPQKDGPNGNPATPSSSSQPIPSPSASSIAEESLDEKPSGTKMPAQPPPQPQQIMSPMPPQTPQTQQASTSASATPATPSDQPKISGKVLSKAELLEKLVGPVTHHNPIHVMHERRMFFERLIDFCERGGEPITMVPQVSKQSIDLHRLYIGVRAKGGFQQVTKDKYWKNLCTEANPDLAESSAAGYQLRKHYQKHLLMLECRETGRNPEDEVAFADKMKRQRKREPTGGAAAAAVAAAAAAQQGGDQKTQQSAQGSSGAPAQGPPGGYPDSALTSSSSSLLAVHVHPPIVCTRREALDGRIVSFPFPISSLFTGVLLHLPWPAHLATIII